MGLFREALACAHQMGDVLAVDSAVRLIGECLLGQGEFEEARSYFEESLRLSDPGQAGWERWVAQGFLLLSMTHLKKGDLSAARAMLDKAPLQTVAHGDDVPSELFMMLHAGNLARVEGDRLAALGFHQKALLANCSPWKSSGARGDRNHVHRLR